MAETTGIAFIGCGYVADLYRQCLDLHPGLRLVGVFDRDPARLAAFAGHWGDRAYASLAEALTDPAAAIVVNLTSVESHAEVSRAAISAGKHVYSEKPLAMTTAEAMALREAARSAQVRVSAAPCNLLSESVQTAWAALRAGRVGQPRLVYAELDDGMVHIAPYRDWISRSGRAWPARDEFHVGCTFEHAGYALGAFSAMFGPARRVTSVSRLVIADKKTDPPLPDPAPDFSVGLIEFDGGVTARLTNSIVANYDHRLRIFGEEGSLEIAELWDYSSPVAWRQAARTRLARAVERRFGGLMARKIALVRQSPTRRRGGPRMDFMRGVAELADALREQRPSRLDEDLAVHIAEVTERLQYPERFADSRVASEFAPISPMPWTS